MCDSGQVPTTANVIVSVSSSGNNSVIIPPTTSGGQQVSEVSMDSNSMSNISNGQSFLSTLVPSTISVIQQAQQQLNQNNFAQQHGHNMGNANVGMESQHSYPRQHPPQNINPQLHSLPPNACSVIQNHLMDNHHVQQVNVQYQHGVHQIPHGSSSSAPHNHAHTHTPQQFMPFGMHLNTNTIGNGNSYASHQMNNYHPHHLGHQIPNQQPAHAMNMNLNPLQQSCFMQHSSCMHFQQNPPPLPPAVNSQHVSAQVGWINGPPPSGPISSHHNNNNVIHTATNSNHSNVNVLLQSCVPTQNVGSKTPTSHPKVQMLPDATVIPGGIEVLWRELPSECQKLMVPQDVPDTARCRGYFTACELLVLKRMLQSRLLGSVKIPASIPTQKIAINKIINSGFRKGDGDGPGKRGPKRRSNNKDRSTKVSRTVENFSMDKGGRNQELHEENEMTPPLPNNGISDDMANCDTEMQHNTDENFLHDADEIMISFVEMKHDIHTSVTPPVTGVGGVVKEAMDALTSTSVNDQSDNGNVGDQSASEAEGESVEEEDGGIKLPENKESESNDLIINESVSNVENVEMVVLAPNETADVDAHSDHGPEETLHQKPTSINEGAIVSQLSNIQVYSGVYTEKPSSDEENTLCSTSACLDLSVTEPVDEDNGDSIEGATVERQKQLTANLTSDAEIGKTSTNNELTNTAVLVSTSAPSGGGCYIPNENRFTGPPPPCRTQTLVLKLLQIGTYHIRSFSSINPNRLRVLFNTQRMAYECQLPVVPPEKLTPGIHPLRKILTIDIGFEQISMLKFGQDSLWMRVEGPPLLTVAFNPVQDEDTEQVLSAHDLFVLDQIEKGQLKLSPVHHLYFINERLVHTLETQFREHPRFRHLMMNNNPMSVGEF